MRCPECGSYVEAIALDDGGKIISEGLVADIMRLETVERGYTRPYCGEEGGHSDDCPLLSVLNRLRK